MYSVATVNIWAVRSSSISGKTTSLICEISQKRTVSELLTSWTSRHAQSRDWMKEMSASDTTWMRRTRSRQNQEAVLCIASSWASTIATELFCTSVPYLSCSIAKLFSHTFAISVVRTSFNHCTEKEEEEDWFGCVLRQAPSPNNFQN